MPNLVVHPKLHLVLVFNGGGVWWQIPVAAISILLACLLVCNTTSTNINKLTKRGSAMLSCFFVRGGLPCRRWNCCLYIISSPWSSAKAMQKQLQNGPRNPNDRVCREVVSNWNFVVSTLLSLPFMIHLWWILGIRLMSLFHAPDAWNQGSITQSPCVAPSIPGWYGTKKCATCTFQASSGTKVSHILSDTD